MDRIIDFVKITLIGGLLVVLPVAVMVYLLRHAALTLEPMLKPVLTRLPDWMPFPDAVALTIEVIVVLLGCFVVGLLIQTPAGRRIGGFIEANLFERLPGYKLLRSLSRRAIGEVDDVQYQVALVEIEGGLVPAFIIEEHQDGRYTVFVPTVPTPTSGSIYIFPRALVHLVDVPFTKAFRCLTRMGSGASDLLQAVRHA
jgi:uncharacterized membrane protein